MPVLVIHHLDVMLENLTVLGEPDTDGYAIKQFDPEILFQALYAFGQCGLTDVQGRCSFCEILFLGHNQETAK